MKRFDKIINAQVKKSSDIANLIYLIQTIDF